MTGRRRKSRKLKTVDVEVDECELSFTINEVKENLRTVGEKFLKWIVEGVPSEKTDEVQEMATSVRQMRNFLIERKKKVEQSKSSRQLMQLETLSPLLDSANYLTLVAKDYLDKIEENQNDQEPQETEGPKEHDSSFVDMFLDEKEEYYGGNSISQKDSATQENAQNMSLSLKANTSKSILRTCLSETPGTQKKITFAKKATKVYEDNETSQISLAKSSGSVKSVDDYDPKALTAQLTTIEKGNSDITFETLRAIDYSRQASEDMFDDAESIVDTSFQEEKPSTSSLKPKNVKLFKAKKLTGFRKDKSTNDGSLIETTKQINDTNVAQDIAADPLLSQESSDAKPSSSSSTNDPHVTLPFHNFRLTLPQDSSSSEASLDARVNMAINLVNTKPREPDLKQQSLPETAETQKHSSDGIIQSTVTCTDFRWMEPMEYNSETSQGSNYKESTLPDTIFEEGLTQKHQIRPFDMQNEDEDILEPPISSNLSDKTSTAKRRDSVHGQEYHPKMGSSVFPPKTIWANPFQSAHFSTTLQQLEINPVEPKNVSSLKDETSGQVQNNNSQSIKGKESETKKKKGELNNIKNPEERKEVQRQSKLSKSLGKTGKILGRTRGRPHKNKAMLEVPKNSEVPRRPSGNGNKLQDTYDSHKYDTNPKFRTGQDVKRALKEAVKSAKTRQLSDTIHTRKPAAASTGETPGQASETIKDNSKIARLRRFGKWWNDPSSTCLPDAEINSNRTQTNSNSFNANTTQKSQPTAGKQILIPKKQVQVQHRPRSKLHQTEVLYASSNKRGELDGEQRFPKNPTTKERSEIHTMDLKMKNEQMIAMETKCSGNVGNLTNNITLNPSNTCLAETVLVNTDQLDNVNTSSMLCETSFSREKSSQRRKKQANSSQNKINVSKNRLKISKKQQGMSKFEQAPKTFQGPDAVDETSAYESQPIRPIGQKPTEQNLPKSMLDPAQAELDFLQVQNLHVSTEPSQQKAIHSVDKGGTAQGLGVPAQNGTWQRSIHRDRHYTFQSNDQNGTASFFETQNESTQSVQFFNQSFNATNFGQDRQINPNDWQFNFQPTIQAEKPRNCPGPLAQRIQQEPPNLNWMPFGTNAVSDGRKDGVSADMGKAAERATLRTITERNMGDRTVSSQTKKRDGQDGGQQPKSPKMMKLQENETVHIADDARHSIGTQGTEVLYEECENLSWASSDDLNTQMMDSHMFDFHFIGPKMFNSQNLSLSPNGDSQRETKFNMKTTENECSHIENEPSLHYEAQNQLPWGFTVDPENPTTYLQENNENHGVTTMDGSDNFNKCCGNTPFQQQDPPGDSEILPVSFTQFKRGVQVSSTELPENTTTQQHNFKKLAAKNKEEIYKHSNNCPSTYYTDSHQAAYTEFEQGIQKHSTELGGMTNALENCNSKEPAKKKSEAEEIEELINSIEWVRRISESELIEAANVEELINDQTFVW